MDKLSGLANLLAIALAVIGAFVAIPNLDLAVVILILGIIGGIAANQDNAVRMYIAVLVLPVIAVALGAIPAVGEYLSSIFSNIGIAAAGISASLITRRLVEMVKEAIAGLTGGSGA